MQVHLLIQHRASPKTVHIQNLTKCKSADENRRIFALLTLNTNKFCSENILSQIL